MEYRGSIKTSVLQREKKGEEKSGREAEAEEETNKESKKEEAKRRGKAKSREAEETRAKFKVSNTLESLNDLRNNKNFAGKSLGIHKTLFPEVY